MRNLGIVIAILVIAAALYKMIAPPLDKADCGGHWCAAAPSAGLTAHGTVVNSDFSPVADAPITVGGKSGFTDSYGRYAIPMDRPGEYNVTIGGTTVTVNVQDWGTSPDMITVK